MKIAITTDAIYPYILGGSERRNHEIGKRLVKKGHEFHIYGGKFWKGKSNIEIEGIKIHGVSTYSKLYDENGKRKPIEPLLLSIKIFLRLIKDKPDLIDNASFNFFNCYTTKLASIIIQKPLIFTWHQYFGNYLFGYFGKTKGTITKSLEYISTKLTKNNLAVSNHVKNELIKRKVSSKKIKVIYNGADTNLIKNLKPFKKKYDLIYIGRLNYQKNLPLLIHSLQLIKNEIPKIKLCIIGGGREKMNLVELMKSLNLESNIDFKGEIKNEINVFKYLKSSKIFVLSSRLEGFPLTIIEANASGLPIITTQTKYNNTKEYITNKENGFLVKPKEEEFSQTILRLLKNNRLRNKMSKMGIEKSREYDWDKLVNEQERYYNEILNQDIFQIRFLNILTKRYNLTLQSIKNLVKIFR